MGSEMCIRDRDMHRRQGAQNRPNPSEVGGRESRRVPLRERKSNPKRAEDERCAQGSAWTGRGTRRAGRRLTGPSGAGRGGENRASTSS